MFSLCISGLSSVQDHVHLMSPCGGSVPGDSYTRQKDQLLCLQTAGRGGQGARSQHGLPAWGLWLHRVQPRGDPLAEWEFDRRHNVAIHTASQVEGNVFYFVSSQQKLPFKDAHKIFLPQIFPGSWRSGCHWVVFMNEDPTGSLTDASTTVTSSSMTKVPSSVASCSIQWQLVAFLCTHTHFVISFTGDIVSVYRKSHLFDIELPEKGVSLKESAFTIPGPTLVSPVKTPIGKV